MKSIVKTKKIYRCLDCNIIITYQCALYGSGRCHSCSNKISMKGHVPWNKGIKNSTNTYWLGKSNKNIVINHHIDLEKNSDRTMKMVQGQHRSLHWNGYKYLVYLGLIEKYISLFLKKYPNVMKAQNVLHHKDCDRSNENKDNLLYLASKAIHNKLHQEAYEYLVDIRMVDNYIKWFLLQENKTTMVNSKGGKKP